MTTTTAEFSRPAGLSSPATLQSLLWLALTVVVLGVAYGPLAADFFASQWARPHYQYFPFVIAAFAWLLWRNYSQAQPRDADLGILHRVGTVIVFSLACLLLGLAYVKNSPWLAIVSAIVLIASQLLRLSRQWRVEYLWGIWAILWLIVPLPLNRDQQLIVWLQHLSSRMSSIILDATGIEHLMEGNTLVLPEKQLFVDEACSGIVSVLSVIACAIIYGVWRNRSPVHVVTLAFLGVCWATVMNVVRITVIAVMLDTTGIDWSAGTPHEMLSLAVFTFILLGLISTDLLLVGIFLPIEPAWEQLVAAPVRFGRSVVRLWDYLIAREPDDQFEVVESPPAVTTPSRSPHWLVLRFVPLATIAVLAALQFTPLIQREVAAVSFSESTPFVQRALACSAETLPPEIGELQRVKFLVQTRDLSDVLGGYSRTYEFGGQTDARFVASCDFPYPHGWHELTVCYRGQGWQLNSRKIATHEAADGTPWEYLEADFAKPDGTKGYLLASAFDDSGQPLALPTKSLVTDAFNALTIRRNANPNYLTFQVQVWTTASRQITQQERDAAKHLLLAARQRFYQHIAQPGMASNQSSAAANL